MLEADAVLVAVGREPATQGLGLAEAGVAVDARGAVVVDEVHALAGTKRGDQLALCLSRLQRLSPGLRRIGLSATVAQPEALRAWIAPDARPEGAALITGQGGADPSLEIVLPEGHLPWGGHMGLASAPEIYRRIGGA